MKTVRILISGIALIVLAACPPVSAEDVFIPASSYTASNNIADNPITVDPYGWLHGLDHTGEWLDYHFDLTGFGVHSSSITVKGTMGVDFQLRMEVTGDASHSFQIVDFNFTGSGFVGWGCEHIVAGSDKLGLYEPGYKVRILTMVSGEIQLYSIELPTLLGTEHSSWGNIKNIHR